MEIRLEFQRKKQKVKMETNPMKHVSAGRSYHDSLAFEHAKRPGDRTYYWMSCSCLPQYKRKIFIFTVEWTRHSAATRGEQNWGLGSMSILRELGKWIDKSVAEMDTKMIQFDKSVPMYLGLPCRYKRHNSRRAQDIFSSISERHITLAFTEWLS